MVGKRQRPPSPLVPTPATAAVRASSQTGVPPDASARTGAALRISGLHLSVGAFALRDVRLELEPGDYAVLLGPTGCGKTLLAETVCGLNRPDSGSVWIGGQDATRSDPAMRNIGYVPQDYALLPFLSVSRNIAFGLRARRLPADEIRRRVDRLLDLLDLSPLRDRHPRSLSGGERQRTALARALAVEPALLVLDEPLSALDESTCETLIPRMAAWSRTFRTTTLHICHRLEEALSLGTRMALMRDGRIEQCGAPETLFSRPVNSFVADFLRLPNRIRGEVRETPEGRRFCVGAERLALTDQPPGPACGLFPQNHVEIALRRMEAKPGYRVYEKIVGRRAPHWIRPGLALNGTFKLFVSGLFPIHPWAEGQRVFVRLPETGWRILPENEG